MDIELGRGLCHVAALKDITAQRLVVVRGVFLVKIDEPLKFRHDKTLGVNIVV